MNANKKGTPFIEVKNLTVHYTSEGKVIHAVNNVSFSLEKGETLGLVGETGAGKTTIAKSILRILPEPPAQVDGGEILLEGKNILALSNDDMRKIRGRKISMIFQDPMTALNPVMRIGNQIAEGIALHEKVSGKAAEEKAKKMLEMVGIPGSRYRDYPHQFSGGMKQRVVIAMALACSPDLLLADEPTTALDVTIQAQVLDIIKNLQQELNTAMIMITHDLGIVAEVCDNVAVVYAGEVVEYGSREEIFDHPWHPYTVGLFGSLPDINSDVERLSPIAGMPPDPSNLPEGCAFAPRCPYAAAECRKAAVELKSLGGTHICRCIRQMEAVQAPGAGHN
ncbi:ABC transporter ATP-binding protein [Murimonas intestini]|uniref:Peptide/nickel transport system ATP-binding protein n=1 Tax=Murimonas intestini TaxID=1337051 RepID=A0AB73SYB9_9FIRM|nr:ABC transporter ATP-binding protein [Murimonas intestini]MCR1868356.1 ABC transporter ATP-binding protein [Murimonas intestini]MCR1885800.1 ABC transporter ATP-binding protein [Murimonas intestini]